MIELSVKWTARDGTRYEHCYEILVEPARGFTVPFVTEAYRENGGALQTIQTIETECVEHGADAWGPKKTVCTALFTTPKGRGNSVTTTTLENVRFNTPVADEELMATLADGTMVDDQLAGQYFKYRVVDEPVLLQSIENSCRKAGFVGLIPIARHDTGSVSGDQTRSTPERNGIAKGDSPDRGATPQVRGGSPIKRIGLGVGLCAASLAGLGLLTHVFVAKRRCRPPSGGA
ncbi:MAG: hypothetical protein MUC88_01175 [Planctomycetes bacterium]|nr:hypothetical protein [Planctomycetota bacterium]